MEQAATRLYTPSERVSEQTLTTTQQGRLCRFNPMASQTSHAFKTMPLCRICRCHQAITTTPTVAQMLFLYRSLARCSRCEEVKLEHTTQLERWAYVLVDG